MNYPDFVTLIRENTSNKLGDYNKLCRFCLTNQSNGIDISNGNDSSKQQIDAILNNYIIIAKQCLPTGEEYPNFVCSSCEDRLDEYAHFAEQIEQNAENWETFLKSCTDMKEERVGVFADYGEVNPMTITSIKVEYCDETSDYVQDTNTYDALDPSFLKIEVKNEILDDITPRTEQKKKRPSKLKLPAFMKLSTEFERTCKYCNEQTFSSLAHLYRHTKQNHPGEKIFSCDICSSKFISKNALGSHMKDRHAKCGKKHQCQYCASLFFSDRELKGHEKYHLNSRAYTCKLCGKSFIQKTSLNVHMKSKAHNADYKTRKNCKNNSKKVFRCQQCVPATVYASSEERANHRNAMHKIHECEICKNSFLTVESLDSHKLLHSERPRPLVCSVCNATFNQSSHLSSHFKRRHTDNKSFQCHFDNCEKMFFENCELNAHIRLVHRKEKRVKCNQCESDFASIKYLQKHILDRHSTVASPYDCKICGKKNGSGANLELHRLKHHKEIT